MSWLRAAEREPSEFGVVASTFRFLQDHPHTSLPAGTLYISSPHPDTMSNRVLWKGTVISLACQTGRRPQRSSSSHHNTNLLARGLEAGRAQFLLEVRGVLRGVAVELPIHVHPRPKLNLGRRGRLSCIDPRGHLLLAVR